MNSPNLVCETYDISPEHPSNWDIRNIVTKDSQVTLGGVLTEDVLHRKYEIVLEWEAMSVTDYDDLEELVNYSLDNNKTIEFTYPKFPQTSSGTTVRAALSSRKRRGGSGATDYYSTVTLILTEVVKRA